MSILLGNGDGTFQSAQNLASGIANVGVGDFNRDGKLDLAVVNGLGNTVSVLLGNADGTFQPHVDYATAGTPRYIALADLNRDGKLDLAVTACVDGCSGTVTGSVSILLGNGDGSAHGAIVLVEPVRPSS